MSKKVILIIASLALAVSLSVISVSCGFLGSTEFVTYTDEANGFAIDHPEKWHVEYPSAHPQIKVAIWKRKVGHDPIGIMVYKSEASGHTLESFSEFQIDVLADRVNDYVPISTEEITVNGMPAIKHVYTQTITSHLYTAIKVYLVQGGAEWVLAIHSPQESLESYQSTFDTALSSFRLLE